MSFIAVGIGAAAAIGGGVIKYRAAEKEKDRADKQAKKAKEELDKQMQAYKNLDTSNPYLNMENVMEDLTINQKQADFEAQQFAQSQSNILEGLRGAAGSSGIAGLAQALAQQGQLASQRSAASIGQQEATNQRAERAMAGQIQSMERKGDLISRGLEKERTETLLGMAQQRRAAALNRQAAARAAKTQAIAGAVEGLGSVALAGLDAGAFSGVGQGRVSQGSSDITTSDLPVRKALEAPETKLNVGGPAALNVPEDPGRQGVTFDEAFRQARLERGRGGTFTGEEFGYFGSPGTTFTTNYDYEVEEGTYGQLLPRYQGLGPFESPTPK